MWNLAVVWGFIPGNFSVAPGVHVRPRRDLKEDRGAAKQKGGLGICEAVPDGRCDSMAVLRTNSWRLSTRVEKRQVLH